MKRERDSVHSFVHSFVRETTLYALPEYETIKAKLALHERDAKEAGFKMHCRMCFAPFSMNDIATGCVELTVCGKLHEQEFNTNDDPLCATCQYSRGLYDECELSVCYCHTENYTSRLLGDTHRGCPACLECWQARDKIIEAQHVARGHADAERGCMACRNEYRMDEGADFSAAHERIKRKKL